MLPNPPPFIVGTNIASGHIPSARMGVATNSANGIGSSTVANGIISSNNLNVVGGNGITVNNSGLSPMISLSHAISAITIACSELKLEPPNELAYQSINRVQIWGAITLSTLYDFSILQKLLLRLIGIQIKRLQTQEQWLDHLLVKATEVRHGTIVNNNEQMSLIAGEILTQNALYLPCGEVTFIMYGETWYYKLPTGISKLDLKRKNLAKLNAKFSKILTDQVNATSD